MAQIYKIYMNQSLLILADFSPAWEGPLQTIGLQEIDLKNLFIESTKEKQQKVYLCIHPEIEQAFKGLLQKIRVIKAAGGLVENGNGEYLFIHRLGKWDLPKGKVEENEKVRDASVREVEEECGIKIDYLGPKITTTYHTYCMRDKFILKQTKWYKMGVNKKPKLTPQTEEDIQQAIWLPVSELNKVRKNTYPLILDLIQGLDQ